MSRRVKRQLEFSPELLSVAREAAGYTQESLARALGVGLRTVTRWESGETEPAAVKLFLLADVLDIEPDDLYVKPPVAA